MAIFLYILSMIAVIAMFPGEVCAETLIDTNFGSANRPVEIIDEQRDLRITGFLPEGWNDNSSWARVHLDYQLAPGAVAGDTLFYLWTPKDIKTLENLLQTTEH